MHLHLSGSDLCAEFLIRYIRSIVIVEDVWKEEKAKSPKAKRYETLFPPRVNCFCFFVARGESLGAGGRLSLIGIS